MFCRAKFNLDDTIQGRKEEIQAIVNLRKNGYNDCIQNALDTYRGLLSDNEREVSKMILDYFQNDSNEYQLVVVDENKDGLVTIKKVP